jgi:hypothetical protein
LRYLGRFATDSAHSRGDDLRDGRWSPASLYSGVHAACGVERSGNATGTKPFSAQANHAAQNTLLNFVLDKTRPVTRNCGYGRRVGLAPEPERNPARPDPAFPCELPHRLSRPFPY